MNYNERKFYKKNLNQVLHATLNPYEPGVVRIHLVPAKYNPFLSSPSLVVLNGKDILPINLSWTILLAIFIKKIDEYQGNEVTDRQLDEIIDLTIDDMKKVYKRTKKEVFREDLKKIISVFMDIAERKRA